MTEKLITASVLAFERKLDPSDAVFHAGRWEDRVQSHAWQPVAIKPKSVRGTISNRLKAKEQDPAKLDAAIENPNLQTVDVAALPPQADTLKVQFTLRVLGGAGTPSACNSAAYRAKLLGTVQGYVRQHGFGELARRYAANLANGRFLWRNRVGAERVEVTVEQMQDGQAAKTWSFDALALNIRAVGAIDSEAKAWRNWAKPLPRGWAARRMSCCR
jgi:CRISPR-associated protein Csy3